MEIIRQLCVFFFFQFEGKSRLNILNIYMKTGVTDVRVPCGVI